MISNCNVSYDNHLNSSVIHFEESSLRNENVDKRKVDDNFHRVLSYFQESGSPESGSVGSKKNALNIRPPQENRKVATFDPNYQTLVGLNNDDVFKPKISWNSNVFGITFIAEGQLFSQLMSDETKTKSLGDDLGTI
ncbi:hypothetical protein DICVIV_00986 [Dictyocaulus viviparus]|uniref:Uncharacterized protein n=1 Tax=Dictyocaulus viviparus TaxID=29172 RepID=A0A0D8Y9Y9_DICVI|nr:hypothetical protein DICVIV_00986 [Dictyocaulus viviparus]